MRAAISNLVHLLQHRASILPDQPAYIFLNGDALRPFSISYAELDAQARVIAGFLQEHRAQGERALLLYPPGLEFVAAFFGCLYAGVIAVPAYPPRLNRNALRILAIAQDCQASLALTTRSIWSRRHALVAHTPELGRLLWHGTDDLPSDAGSSWNNNDCLEESLAYLQYTSGSTATPKGVMVTHANVLENSRYLAEAFDHSDRDVSLSWLPHFHDLGLVHGIVQPLYSCFPGYLMAPMSFLQRPFNWLHAISKLRVTHSDGPNFAYELCISKITDEERKQLDLACWRMALTGAEPVFPETIEKFSAVFAASGFRKTAFYPAYGLAEATLVVSGGKQQPEPAYCSVLTEPLEHQRIVFAEKGAPGSRMLAASGSFAPPMEVAIVEPDSGKRCPPDAIGEIWVSGPSVALGYWQRREESSQVFTARLSDDHAHGFLRTGDLGFIHRGDLFIAGRLKELIIIRGRNFYPQDIERTARESCPDVRLGTGAAFFVSAGTEESLVLVQEVSRRQGVEQEKLFAQIRQAIAEEYEIQVHHIVLVNAGSIPKTSSGKIQRGLCRKQFLEKSLEIIGQWLLEAAPKECSEEIRDAESIQRWIQSRVALRIGAPCDRVDIHRPLSQFALDSLGAVELTHEIQRALHIIWSPATFLEDATIAELAARAAEESETKQNLDTYSKETRDEYPLSYGQQGLWFLQQLAPASTAYNVVQAIRIRSELDVPALRQSFQELVERHAALRTTITNSNGKPVQRVHKNACVAFQFKNAEGWDEAQLRERLASEAALPFDLERGPLFRVHLFRRSDVDHVLVVLAHHLIIDLWSLAQMVTELGLLYQARINGTMADLPLVQSDYSDFVSWQARMLAGEKAQELWSYWSRQLSGELPVLELPVDYRRPAVQTYRGASSPFKLSDDLSARLRSLSLKSNTTLYVTLMAAFAVLLHRYTGEEEITIGTPTSGRTRAEFASTVGYFVNPVVIRSTVAPQSTFEEFLKVARKTTLQALEYQDYPFSLLIEKLQPVRDPARSPLFQVMCAMQKAHLLHKQGLSLFALGESGGHMILGGLEAESFGLAQRIAQFDLSLIIAEADGAVSATFEYNTDLFHAATICRMAQQFVTLLESIAANPAQEVSSLPLLGPEQITELVRAGHGEETENAPICVHELFERQVARTPDAPAICFEGRQFSYWELNQRADQLARFLKNSGARTGCRVAVCLERSPEMIISALAVFKTGAVYLPLDPDHPVQRLDFLLNDAGVELLVTREHLPKPTPQSGMKILYAEDCIFSENINGSGTFVSEADLAYVIYTSGSTGEPKGVLVNHTSFSNHMQWLAREFPLGEGDRVLQKYSSCFDASLSEIFHPLICGAALVMARAGGQHDSGYLLELMREHRVTSLDTVPTMLTVLVEDSRVHQCKDLRRIMSGGEALSVGLQERIYDRLGPLELVNMYGPTEATITAAYYRCRTGQNRSPIPIGTPIANSQLHILDSALQPVAIGVAGEIYIGGKPLALGYLNRPQLTAEKFIPNPFAKEPGARLYRTGDLGRRRADSQIDWLGRTDNQVKIRGFRIELGEIEAELRRHSSVLDAVAVLKTHPGKTKYVAAYVQPANGQQISISEISAYLYQKLPDYMIPAVVVPVEHFSLLPSGKIDIRSLPDPENLRLEIDITPPRQEIERELVRIWQEVLGRHDIGIHNNFFELGGDSILSIQMVSQAREIGLQLSPNQIFRFQTIAALAQVAEKSFADAESGNMVSGPVPLTPIQQWFFEQDLHRPDHYIQGMMLQLRQPLVPKLLREALRYLVTRHDALRFCFQRTSHGWQQKASAADDQEILHSASLGHLDLQEQAAKVEGISAELATSLNVTAGPVIRAAYFDLGENPHRLLIVAHHLSIDGVSWRILLNELEKAYQQLARGEEIALGRKSLSFQRWSELLQSHARSEVLSKELDWWIGSLSGVSGRLPGDAAAQNTDESSETLAVSFSAEETRRLLQEVPLTYRTEINDALLAALAQTLVEWSGSPRVLIDVEGHGREEIIEGVDISRTIGWFTTLYPVRLDIPGGFAPGMVLKAVKQQLRAVPQKGIGYGLLRYLAADQAGDRLRGLPSAQVSFNYLGQLDQMLPATSVFELVGFKAPENPVFGCRSHLLEIDGYIKDRSLQFKWTYSRQVHDRKTIEQLANNFTSKLRTILEHCSSRAADESTPDDFPLIRITQAQINRVQVVHGPLEDIYPLSSMQQGMLFHSLYEPGKATYLTQFVCEICGDLDKDSFRLAWRQVVRRYSALRATFESEIVTEEPVQVIRYSQDREWGFEDWSYISPEQHQKSLNAYLERDRDQGMDVQRGPLMRFGLIQTGVAKHILVWSSHHLLMDGWSLPIVLKDVLLAYDRLRAKQPADVSSERPYRDYIAWLERQDVKGAEEFWRRLLRGFTTSTGLDFLKRENAASMNADGFREQEVNLTEAETLLLTEFARQHHLTLSIVAQGLWGMLLSRVARTEDVVFGVVVSGRRMLGAETMVGVFINTLPMRAKIEPAETLEHYLSALQEQQSEAAQFEYTSLSSIHSWSEIPRGSRLFDTIVVFENYPAHSWREISKDLQITNVRSFERSNYPLTLWIIPGQQLSLKIGFDSHFIDASRVKSLLEAYCSLLASVRIDRQQRLTELLESTSFGEIAVLPAPLVETEPRLAAADNHKQGHVHDRSKEAKSA